MAYGKAYKQMCFVLLKTKAYRTLNRNVLIECLLTEQEKIIRSLKANHNMGYTETVIKKSCVSYIKKN
jgi:hypothetical protein